MRLLRLIVRILGASRARTVRVERDDGPPSAASPWVRGGEAAGPNRDQGPGLTVVRSALALSGRCYVVDGDTIVISGRHIRLAGIDAPELDHPWGQKAKWALVALTRQQIVTAEVLDESSHDRLVAVCRLPDGRDLAAEMVKLGLALDWRKHSQGRYRHLETEGARKRHWRAAARQRGQFPPREFDRP